MKLLEKIERRIVNHIIWKYADDIQKVFYNHEGLNVGNNVQIRKNVFFDNPPKIHIGDNTFINYGCNFHANWDSKSKIIVGNNVFFAPNVSVITGTHEIGDYRKRASTTVYKTIEIKDGVWIGANCSIHSGVTIGEGCIIAANSTVLNDCEPNCLYAGNPAKKIKEYNF